jgi:hypothetical protein
MENTDKKQVEYMVNELMQSIQSSLDMTPAEALKLFCETAGVRPPTIMVFPQNCYGTELYRPLCKTSQSFCRIAKTKNVTAEMLREIKEMGYRVVTPEKEL